MTHMHTAAATTTTAAADHQYATMAGRTGTPTGGGDRDRWETQLRPVLAVCAAAGVGPVLPLPLAVAAAARLGGPSTPTRFLDSVVRLSGLIVRAKPGQPEEQLGIFHLSLGDDYLLRPDLGVQFSIDAPEAHRALADALRELAPAEQHDPPTLCTPTH